MGTFAKTTLSLLALAAVAAAATSRNDGRRTPVEAASTHMRVSASHAGALPTFTLPTVASAAEAANATAGFHLGAATMLLSKPNLGSIAVGDVTGDFRDDLVEREYDYAAGTGAVHIYAQRADGTFAAPLSYSYAPDHSSQPMRLGDVDGDGTLDVVVAGRGDITMLMADGVGAFRTRTFRLNYPNYDGIGCYALEVADLDVDGRADVICGAKMAPLMVYFEAASATPVRIQWGSTGWNNPILKAHDFSGDGIPDLVEGSDRSGQVIFRKSDGRRGVDWVHWPTIFNEGQLLSFASADVDGDGRRDLILNTSLQEVWVIPHSDGSVLGTPVRMANIRGSVRGADLDRDGLDDLIVQEPDGSGQSKTMYLLQGPRGQFGSGTAITAQNGAAAIVAATADLNGDGCTDVLLRVADGLALAPGRGCAAPAPVASAAAPLLDLGGDGTPDLLWRHDTSGELYGWAIVDGQIAYGGTIPVAAAGTARIATGMFDGDGLADVLVTDGVSVQLHIASPDGRYTSRHLAGHPWGWRLIGTGDVDGDGTSDVAWYNPSTRELYFWMVRDGALQSGRGGMVAPATAPPVAFDDFNGDGQADLLFANSLEMDLYESTGLQTFKSRRVAGYPYGWRIAATGDLDGDGRSDLLWHQPQTGETYFWLMAGSRVDARMAGPSVGSAATPVALADFNRDGATDMLLTSPSEVWIYRAQADASFEPTYLSPYPLAWSLANRSAP